MKSALTYTREPSLGFKARRLRISRRLSRRKLADLAGVSQGEVGLFEQDLPLKLDARRRILRELWAKKNGSG